MGTFIPSEEIKSDKEPLLPDLAQQNIIVNKGICYHLSVSTDVLKYVVNL